VLGVLGEHRLGLYADPQFVGHAPKAHVEQRVGRGREGKAVVGIVVTALGVLVDVRGLHDAGLLHRGNAVTGGRFWASRLNRFSSTPPRDLRTSFTSSDR
jgi:hypothetical protein